MSEALPLATFCARMRQKEGRTRGPPSGRVLRSSWRFTPDLLGTTCSSDASDETIVVSGDADEKLCVLHTLLRTAHESRRMIERLQFEAAGGYMPGPSRLSLRPRHDNSAKDFSSCQRNRTTRPSSGGGSRSSGASPGTRRVDELAPPDMLLQYSLHAPRRGHDDIQPS